MIVARLALLSVLAMLGAMLTAASQELVMIRTGEPIAPIPSVALADPAKLRLGERLFRDPRLSRDNKVACTSWPRILRASLGEGDDDYDIPTLGPNPFHPLAPFRSIVDGGPGADQAGRQGRQLSPVRRR